MRGAPLITLSIPRGIPMKKRTVSAPPITPKINIVHNFVFVHACIIGLSPSGHPLPSLLLPEPRTPALPYKHPSTCPPQPNHP